VAGAGLSVVPRKTSSRASRAAESLFVVLFPADCRICAAPLVKISRLPVCSECLEQLLPVYGQLCSVRGERMLSPHVPAGSDGQPLGPVCQRVEQPFANAVAYGDYQGGLRELIHLLKCGGVRPAAGVLGRMLAEADRRVVRNGMLRNEMVLGENVLERKRETKSQIGLTIHQRQENVRGAFAVRRAQEVNGREVLLVDDVCTTGATVSKCARVRRRAGATKVWVATVARTLKLASKYGEMKPAVGVSADVSEASLAKAVS
jgi:predicted amidophosphoribosyltransferase